MLSRSGAGFGALALAGLLGNEARADEPLAPRRPHFAPKAKRVIEVFCSGALSHVDTFDYKPELIRRHGQPLPGNEKLVSFQGPNGNLTQPLWTFRPRGQCEKMVSDLVPHIGALADEICFLHSLTNKSNTHGPAENVMNTGFAFDGFPSMGAWVNYALGSENQNLPAFVAIEDPRGMPQSGPNNWANGFLPAAFQGTPFSSTKPIRFLQRPKGISAAKDEAARAALRVLEKENQTDFPNDANLAARVSSYELAARMQLTVPGAASLKAEPAHIRKLYGADSANKNKAAFANNCILARRLVEVGVRCVSLSFSRWDWHGGNFNRGREDFPMLDQGLTALVEDLHQRGMDKDVAVVCWGEFGRTPTINKDAGRDHWPRVSMALLACGGLNHGQVIGATDRLGGEASERPVTFAEVHATLYHALGIDPNSTTVKDLNGRPHYLVENNAQPLHEVI